jgi:hypothetical protein
MSDDRSCPDPLEIVIRALNDIPDTRFRQPVGMFRSTYELVAWLERIRRCTSEVRKECDIGFRTGQAQGAVHIYCVPTD